MLGNLSDAGPRVTMADEIEVGVDHGVLVAVATRPPAVFVHGLIIDHGVDARAAADNRQATANCVDQVEAESQVLQLNLSATGGGDAKVDAGNGLGVPMATLLTVKLPKRTLST